MSRIRTFFRGLTGQLILSYTIVTLAVTLTLQLGVGLLPLLQDPKRPSLTPADILNKQAGLLATALEQPSPDPEALLYLAAMPLFGDLKQADSHPALTVILDGNGRMLATTACTQQQAISSANPDCSSSAKRSAASLLALSVVREAVQDSLTESLQRPGGASRIAVQGNTILVAPVLGSQGRAVGVLVASFQGPLSLMPSPTAYLGAFAAVYWEHWKLTWVYFLLLACLIGTLAGVVSSRGLTRRLHRLMQAAHTWSRGEFTNEVQDGSPDEVGQLTRDLNAMAAEIQSLLFSRQMLAVLDERNRLARELHDTVKQHVFSSALLVQAAHKWIDQDPLIAQKHLEDSVQLHEQVQQDLVEILQALRPASILKKGLAGALQELAQAWGRRNQIIVDVRIPSARPAPTAIEETLYHIAQEALSNISRHSGAKTVEIQVVQENGRVTMVIRDDGHGFDVLGTLGKGSGLTNMRERVEMAGGEFDLTSSAEGTVLVIQLPV